MDAVEALREMCTALKRSLEARGGVPFVTVDDERINAVLARAATLNRGANAD